MRLISLSLIAAVAVAGCVATAGAAPTPAGCQTLPRVFASGALAIFSQRYRSDGGGALEWACSGSSRPLLVGSQDDNYGGRSQAYAYDGSRYLVEAGLSVGEGGGNADFVVWDMRRRRRVSVIPATASDDPPPPFRVTSTGAVIAQDVSLSHPAVTAYRPRYPREARGEVLSTPGVSASQIALIGTTVYWTEASVARSAQLTGPPTPSENRILADVVTVRARRPCDAQPGRTVAGVARVRVLRRGGRQVVCTAARDRPVPLPAGSVTITGDRWVLSRARSRAWLLDASTGRIVQRMAEVAEITVLPDGTVAWSTLGGRLLTATRQHPAPSTLAVAGGAPHALASSTSTVYWTAGGAPHELRGSAPETALSLAP